MWLSYWYEDELNERKKVKGRKAIYLTSRDFERVFGHKERYVFITRESKSKAYRTEDGELVDFISSTQLLRYRENDERLNDIWKNLKNIRDIRDVAVPYRIQCEE